jgi:DNA-binding LacI/PurR family transcriptional regulator
MRRCVRVVRGNGAPALTTVHIDAEAHGRQAARTVLGLSAVRLSSAPGRVTVRESA